MKRVLLVSAEYGSEGGGLSCSAERLKLALEGIEGYVVSVVSSVPSGEERAVVAGGYDSKVTAALSDEAWLGRCVERFRNAVDLVMAFGGGRNGYFSMLLAQELGASFVISYRGSDANLLRWNPIEMVMAERTISGADGIACLSEEQSRKLNTMFGAVRRCEASVIPNVIMTDVPVNRRPAGARDLVLGCGATHLNEKKGVGLLIRTTASLARKWSGALRFEFVGAVDPDLLLGYEELARRLGVADRVLFTGRVGRAEFDERMTRWDYYVQGSVCEGFSNSVAEAIGRGVKVLLTPTGYIAENLLKTFPEAVFPGADPELMADAVLRVVNGPDTDARYQAAYAKLAEGASECEVMGRWRALLETPGTVRHEGTFSSDDVLAVLFHDIRPDVRDGITASPAAFDAFVGYAVSRGFRCCSISERLNRRWGTGRPLVLTFDDGYSGVAEYALPILARYGMHASVFVCSDLIGKSNAWNCKDRCCRRHMGADDLKRLTAAGWDIGSHGLDHRSMLRLDAADVDAQLRLSKAALESLLGIPVTAYAYPYGDYSRFVRSEVSKSYDVAFSMDGGGTHLAADRHSLRRYMPGEIRRILEG